MNCYDLTFIIKDQESEEKLIQIKERVKKLLSDTEIIKEENLGRRELAYPILKNRFGNYFSIIFKATADKILQLNKKLKMEEEILRFMLVKVVPEKLKPTTTPSQPQPKKAEPKKVAKEKTIKPKEAKEETTTKTEAIIEKEKKSSLKEEIQKEEAKLNDLDKKLKEILKE